jgi:hypothetical protein
VGYAISTFPAASEIRVYSPFESAQTRTLVDANRSNDYRIAASNVHTVASPFDGFTVYPGSGTITGSLYVYGYRKAL